MLTQRGHATAPAAAPDAAVRHTFAKVKNRTFRLRVCASYAHAPQGL